MLFIYSFTIEEREPDYIFKFLSVIYWEQRYFLYLRGQIEEFQPWSVVQRQPEPPTPPPAEMDELSRKLTGVTCFITHICN